MENVLTDMVAYGGSRLGLEERNQTWRLSLRFRHCILFEVFIDLYPLLNGSKSKRSMPHSVKARAVL